MRNANGRFSDLPSADISRSTFDRSASVKTTFNVGDLIPFYLDEVLPGDTYQIDTSKVVRLQTPLTPIMDNLYLDTYYFFVPSRLCWNHWVNLMGENTESPWVDETVYTVPQVTAPTGGWQTGTIADYMGVPVGVSKLSVNALPFRAYALIVDQWFRDQNLQQPVNIPFGDATQAGSNGSNYINDLALGGKPFVAGKLHDYFTSCLPAPQKGPDVTLPLISDAIAPLPVQATSSLTPVPTSFVPMQLRLAGHRSNSYSESYWFPKYMASNAEPQNGHDIMDSAGGTGFSNVSSFSDYSTPSVYGSQPANLWADTSGLTSASVVSINQLRLAFQTQKYFEKLARGGSRYIESLKTMFGVTNPDYRLQRPEYLGGNRIPITINQVIQQSQSTESSPQGATTGQSLTTDIHSDFTKSFTEHGYVIGLCVARYRHTYQQGLHKLWTRKAALDFYNPVFANIGEQPVYNREIYAQGKPADAEVFGYQEAWAEYRYRPSICTGEMRSTAPKSLDIWHLGDDYASQPYLSDAWIREDKSNVDRVLAVQSGVSNQLFADIYVANKCTRAMPVFSVPGLIDHH